MTSRSTASRAGQDEAAWSGSEGWLVYQGAGSHSWSGEDGSEEVQGQRGQKWARQNSRDRSRQAGGQALQSLLLVDKEQFVAVEESCYKCG